MANSFKPKIILHDVPDILTKPLDAELSNEDLHAAVADCYAIAMRYFGIDPLYREHDQDLAFHLLGLVFPAFDWPKPRGKAGRPRTPPWKLRTLHRLKKEKIFK